MRRYMAQNCAVIGSNVARRSFHGVVAAPASASAVWSDSGSGSVDRPARSQRPARWPPWSAARAGPGPASWSCGPRHRSDRPCGRRAPRPGPRPGRPSPRAHRPGRRARRCARSPARSCCVPAVSVVASVSVMGESLSLVGAECRSSSRGSGRRGRVPESSVMSNEDMATVLMPIPACDFDPSEVAVSWQVLSAAGHDVLFATPSGQMGEADDLMVTGQGLDPWGFVPGVRRLTVVGRFLRADAASRHGVRGVARGPCVPLASALGGGAPRRLRRARAAGRPPRPRHAHVPREPRGATDGGGLVPGRQARGRDLSRRPGGGAGDRSGHRALGAARAAHDGAHLVIGAQGVGGRTVARVSGTPTTTGPTPTSPASGTGTCRCSRR